MTYACACMMYAILHTLLPQVRHAVVCAGTLFIHGTMYTHVHMHVRWRMYVYVWCIMYACIAILHTTTTTCTSEVCCCVKGWEALLTVFVLHANIQSAPNTPVISCSASSYHVLRTSPGTECEPYASHLKKAKLTSIMQCNSLHLWGLIEGRGMLVL